MKWRVVRVGRSSCSEGAGNITGIGAKVESGREMTVYVLERIRIRDERDLESRVECTSRRSHNREATSSRR